MKVFWLFSVFALFVACDYFEPKDDRVVVARVNKSLLYEEDITGLVNAETTPEDSTLLVSNYITQWATQQLLIDQAKINIPLEDQERYNRLVTEYRNSLFAEAYKNIIVSRELDTLVTETELQAYYDRDKQNFLLSDNVYKLRFVYMNENSNNEREIQEALKRFDDEDVAKLQNMQLQFKNFNLNDSVWVKKETLLENIPILNSNQNSLKKDTFAKLKDSTGVYFIKVVDELGKNDIAPLAFIKPTIKQIVRNKRKLELIKKIELDITKDASITNKFETYTNLDE